MKERLLNAVRRRTRRSSDVAPTDGAIAPDADLHALPESERRIVEAALPHSITSVPRILAIISAVRYCEGRRIEGAFVECGVWQGGSVLAMILALQELGAERDIYLYDTFEGMTAPTADDVSRFHRPAVEIWNETEGTMLPEYFAPEIFSEQGVRERLLSSGYPEERLHFVRGPVEETVPGRAPEKIALLRLDTDWYESTHHELIHLYPRVTDGGVLIIDDYGHWDGCRRAVDEYFETEADPILLNRIDYTARMAVKA